MIKPFCCFAFLTLIVGCATGAPPSAFERTAYTVTTNFVTNINAVVQIGASNNVVATNFVTNVFSQYQLEPRPEVIAGIQTAGTVATTFGFGLGGVIVSVLLGAYGAYAKWQSARRGKANVVLTNNIEVGHETILATAGAAVAAQFIEAIKSAQVKAGVKEDIAAVVDNNVDEQEARMEAASLVAQAKRPPPVVKRTSVV